jgi:hypothetical protein
MAWIFSFGMRDVTMELLLFRRPFSHSFRSTVYVVGLFQPRLLAQRITRRLDVRFVFPNDHHKPVIAFVKLHVLHRTVPLWFMIANLIMFITIDRHCQQKMQLSPSGIRLIHSILSVE